MLQMTISGSKVCGYFSSGNLQNHVVFWDQWTFFHESNSFCVNWKVCILCVNGNIVANVFILLMNNIMNGKI